MTDLFDYLTWRGDLSIKQVPFCPVDALILSTLSYVHFDELVSEGAGPITTISQAATAYLSNPAEKRGRCRCEQDLKLLKALSDAPRFSQMGLSFREEQFIPEKQLQFGALAVLLGDGTSFLTFRGTDSTLVGWKEDFNMSFMDTVPAQSAAAVYVRRFAQTTPGPLILGGHSKGGNLAVYAGITCDPSIQERIVGAYSFDGPGFPSRLLSAPGYEQLLPRIHTFLPRSSVVGILLDRKEPYTVVRSGQIGPLQHDPYSWQVLGGDFVRLEEIAATSRFADRTLTQWLAGLTPQQREQVIDVVYEFVASGVEVSSSAPFQPHTLFHPQTLAAMFRFLRGVPEEDLKAVTDSLNRLVRSAVQVLKESR